MSSTSFRPGLFPRDERGAVAVLFATAIVPIAMLCGLAIDFGFVLQARAQLDMAADTAVLAAARTAADAYTQSQPNYMTVAQNAGTQWWTAQTGNLLNAQNAAPTITVSQSGRTFTATVSYTANVAEVMPSLFKWTNPNGATISNTSVATITANPFGTVHFLLDNTSSMMLPATDADLVKLQNAEGAWLNLVYNGVTNLTFAANQVNVVANANGLVGANATGTAYTLGSTTIPLLSTLGLVGPSGSTPGNYCAFACHWNASSSGTNVQDYYGLARSSGEKLRFDLVQTATQVAIQAMVTQEQVPGQLNVGVFAFGGPSMTSSSYFKTIYPVGSIDGTSTGAGAASAISTLATITPPVTGDASNTNIGTALTDLLATAGASGTGNTAASPQKSLIMVTDGVEDDASPQVIPSTEGPLNTNDLSACQALRTAGYSIYILYTPYNSASIYLPNSTALQAYLNPVGSSPSAVQSALISCVGGDSSNVIAATSQTDIQAGMQTLLAKAVGSATRLTN